MSLTLLAVLAWIAPQETEAKHPWASFKVGSYVKMKTSTKMEGMDPMVSEMKQTLVELTADKAVIETEVMGYKTKSEMPLKFEKKTGGDESKEPKPKVTEEKLKIGEKEYACKVTVVERDGTTSKVWMCEQIPGGWAKSEVKNKQMTTTTEVVEFEAKK